MSRINLTTTISNTLDGRVTQFIQANPGWSLDALVETALELFLDTQTPKSSRAVDPETLEALEIEIESGLYERLKAVNANHCVLIEDALQHYLKVLPSRREQLNLFEETA